MITRFKTALFLFYAVICFGINASQEEDTNALIVPGMRRSDIGVGDCGGGSGSTYNVTTAADSSSNPTFYIYEENADFIAINFAAFNIPPSDFVVLTATDKDTGDVETQVIYGREHTKGFVSNMFFSTNITIELFSTQSPSTAAASVLDGSCTGFYIDSYRYAATGGTHTLSTQETVCGADDSRNAACYKYLSSVYTAAKTILRMVIYKSTGTFYCTGWLVGCEGHVMTNEHCIANQEEASNVKFEFMAEGSSCSSSCAQGGRCKGTVLATSATLIAVDEALDYALLKLSTTVDLNEAYGYLTMREEGPKLDERIYIPQHPAGWGKHIAIKNEGEYAKITTLTRSGCASNQAGYFADTQGGSSGSPVLSSTDNAVVALHHCGGCPNTGIQIQKVIADLKSKGKLPKCATSTVVTEAPTAAPTPKPTLAPTPAPTPSPAPTEKPTAPPTQASLVQQATLDGTIYQTLSRNSIDFISFTVPNDDTVVEIDLLSMETSDFVTFEDVNSDCDASFIDTTIILFKTNGDDLKTGTLIETNDDAPAGFGKADGSITLRDSFLSATLDAGSYRLAVGAHPLTVEDAINGEDVDASGSLYPFACNHRNADHGNYRVSLSATSALRSISDSGSYIGSQCSESSSANENNFENCPYHRGNVLTTLAATIDGSIYRRGDSSASVDYIHFNLAKDSDVELDILSMETKDFVSFVDLNNDCDASFIDSVIFLFKRNNPNDMDLSRATFVATNDDVDSTEIGARDGSISVRDSFLSLSNLDKGIYVVAVGRHPMTIDDAIAQSTPASDGEFQTPFECDYLTGGHGNYQLSIRTRVHDAIDGILSPESAFGATCNPTMDEPLYEACPYHAPSLPLTFSHEFNGAITKGSSEEGGSKVNYLKFALDSPSSIELDILSAESRDFATFTDVNGDCDASFIDSVVILFKFGENADSTLEDAAVIAINDDAPSDLGSSDGSVSHRDSFVSAQVSDGFYVLAIGRYPMTVEDAIAGAMNDKIGRNGESISPRIFKCHELSSSDSNDYGNYRVTLRSSSTPSVVEDPEGASASSSKCTENPAVIQKYPQCPYHVSSDLSLLPRAMIDGTIYRQDDTIVTVDHVKVSVAERATLIFDVLSYEQDSSTKLYSDLNGDCDGSYIDSVIYLFNDVNGDGVIDPDSELVVSNDDDKIFKQRNNQQSKSFRDSYLETTLEAGGNYVLAIGRFPLSVAEAATGVSKSFPHAYSPMKCGEALSDYGSYRLLVSSSSSQVTVESPKTYIGSQCSKNGNNPVC